MDNTEIIEATGTALRLRHTATGHVFTYSVEGGDLVPGPVEEGHGPKDPGDGAADVRAAAKKEAERRGLI